MTSQLGAKDAASTKLDSESGASLKEEPAPEGSIGAAPPPIPPPSDETTRGEEDQDVAGESRSASKACLELTPEEKLSLGAFDPHNPIYPVTYRHSLRPSVEGEQVMAVRIIECEPESNFAVVSMGKMLKVKKDGKLTLNLNSNLAVTNYYNQSGAAWDFASAASSLDETDTWCIPRKEFCTKQVGFNDFGLKGNPGDQFNYEVNKVFSLSSGRMMALQAMITEHCGKRPAPQELCIAYGPDKKFCRPLTMEYARALYPELSAEPAAACASAMPVDGAQMNRPDVARDKETGR
jgi:hypothetical protein